MGHILLHGNRRIALLLAALGGTSLAISLGALAWTSRPWWIWGVAVIGIGLAAWCGWMSRVCAQPRLSLYADRLDVSLRSGSRVSVPLEAVEVFFIGQGAVKGQEPGQPKHYEGAVAANVIVRLAERASEWHDRQTNLALGVWCDGYITVRGLWCENIDSEVLKSMNHALADAKRQQRST